MIDVSTDNGSTWTAFNTTVTNANVPTAWIASSLKTISLGTSIDAQSQVKVRFRSGGGSGTSNLRIDDVRLEGTAAVAACTAPATQASGITFPTVNSGNIDVDWTDGSGAGRVVIMNSTNSFTTPTTGANPTADVTWNNAGEQVIYNGTGNGPISVSNLDPSTTYHFRVYEYCSPDRVYQAATATDNPKSQATTAAAANTITTTAASFGPFCDNAASSSFNVAFTSTGSYIGDFLVQISDASGVFTDGVFTGPTIIGNNSTSPISATWPSGTAAGTGYRLRVIHETPATYGTNNGSNIIVNTPPAAVTFTTATATNNNLTPCLVANNYTIDAQPGYSYSWSVPAGWSAVTGGTTNQITVTPSLATGDVSATVSIAGCAPASALLSITPNDIPAAPVVNGGVSPQTTNVNFTDFFATWSAVPGATGYYMELSTSPTFTATTLAPDLFISEYVEGSGSEKYIEVYNGTGSSVNLSDYELRTYANGSATPFATVALSGTLANGAVAVYKNSAATLYPSATANNAVDFNGDDAVVLYNTSTAAAVDIFGRIGQDPGTAWTVSTFTTLNKTLVRKPSISAGNTSNTMGFPALGTEWNQSNIDVVSDLGSHTFSATSPSFFNSYDGTIAMGTATTEGVIGLSAGTTYYYRIRTINDCGVSVYSNVVSFTTLSSNFDIEATAGANGNISPSGTVSVSAGNNQSFTITADPGYVIADVEVDGSSVGAVGSYTFNIVSAPHTIHATFALSHSFASVIAGNAGEATTISSLSNGTITNNTEGTQVWKFRLYDGDGTNDDADIKPTIYTQFTIRAGAGNTVPSWSTVINNVKFFQGPASSPISGSFLVSPTTISFTPSTPISVADGAGNAAEITMRLTLDNPMAAGTDGQRLVFELATADVTVGLSSASSQLASFNAISDNTKNIIDVDATLQFINAPVSVPLGSNFSVTVSAIDANGNIDLNETTPITLALSAGAGTLTGGATQSLVNGTTSFTALSYNTAGSFDVTASGGSFAPITATILSTTDPYQLFDDFDRADNAAIGIPSSGGTTAWTETETGDGTKVRLVSNRLTLNNCIISDPTGSSGGTLIERISFDGSSKYATTFNTASDVLTWVFNMKQSRSNPSGFSSGGYGAAYVLGCNMADFTDPAANGYAVVLGDAAADNIKLIRFAGGLDDNANVTNIALSGVAPGSNYASVKVTYNPCGGEWSIQARNDGSSNFNAPQVSTPAFAAAVTATNTTYAATDLKYFGALWNHNSSCTETAMFDNLYIPTAVTLPANTKIWKGITSDWSDDNNWTPCAEPVSTDNVTIPATANNPVVSATAFCRDLTIQTGAGLTINAGQFLNVHNNLTNNGSANLGNGTLSIQGGGAAVIQGTITVGNVDIDKNTSFVSGSVLNIKESLELESGNFNATDATVTLKSDASQTAYLDNFTTTNSGTYSGNLTVERHVSNTADGYRDISSPVSTTVADLADDVSVFGQNGVNCWYSYNPYPNVQVYDEALSIVNGNYYEGWKSYTGLSNPLSAMKGVAIRTYAGAPYTIDLRGTPYNGPQSIGITHTSTGTPNADGWNLVGNPYPSPIDWNDVFTANTGIGTSYYAFNTTGEYTGNYSSWNGSTGANGGTRNIAVGQGFFVYKNAPGTGNLSMTNAIREADATTVFHKSSVVMPDEIRLQLTGSGNSDEIVAYTDGTATWNYDVNHDAQKIAAGSTVYMSYKQLGKEYAINVIDEITETTELPLVLWVTDTGTYTLEATELNVDGYITYLKDAELNTLTDLTTTASVTLPLNGGQVYEGRYSIVFEAVEIPSGIVTVKDQNIKIYSHQNIVVVERNNDQSATITISNTLGQTIKEVSSDSKRTEVTLDNTNPWYAIVKVKEANATQTGKVLIK
ncbi:MAG: lamin tail domain-containing protein [Bacteroidetes bacterium]|nr:lamin tail domain-containing protein [Bacteroidota bacterium]